MSEEAARAPRDLGVDTNAFIKSYEYSYNAQTSVKQKMPTPQVRQPLGSHGQLAATIALDVVATLVLEKCRVRMQRAREALFRISETYRGKPGFPFPHLGCGR